MREDCKCCCTKISNLSVILDGQVILDRLNFHIHCGEILLITGPNGAGKSTLIRSLLGEIPYRGEIAYLNTHTQKKMKPLFGFVPQRIRNAQFFPLTVKELFSLCVKNIGQEIISLTGISSLLDKNLKTLSGGELQRVFLAFSLSPLPDILFLDEPTSGVDFEGQKSIYRLLVQVKEKYHMAQVLISHDLDLALEYSDRIIKLNRYILSDERIRKDQKQKEKKNGNL